MTICAACRGTGLRDWFRFNLFGIQIGIGMSGVCAFCHGTGIQCQEMATRDRHPGWYEKNWRKNRHTCGEVLCRNERFDAYFCGKCDVWLSPACDADQCGGCDVGICTGRPEKPSQIEEAEENDSQYFKIR